MLICQGQTSKFLSLLHRITHKFSTIADFYTWLNCYCSVSTCDRIIHNFSISMNFISLDLVFLEEDGIANIQIKRKVRSVGATGMHGRIWTMPIWPSPNQAGIFPKSIFLIEIFTEPFVVDNIRIIHLTAIQCSSCDVNKGC